MPYKNKNKSKTNSSKITNSTTNFYNNGLKASQFFYLADLEIKKIDEDRFILYNHITKRSFIIDSLLVELILHIAKHESLKELEHEFANQFKDFSKVMYFLMKEKIISRKSPKRYLKYWKFNIKLPKFIIFILFLTMLFVIISGLVVLFKNPLHYHELIICPGFCFLFAFYISWFFLGLIHEFAHLIVANYFGCAARIYVKFYFIFPALVTDIPRVVILERWKRIIVHSIGMFTDLFLMSLFLILAQTFPSFFTIFRFFAIIKFFSLVSQLNIHFRTDLYFLLEDLLNAINLKDEALALLRGQKKEFLNPVPVLIAYLIFFIIAYSLNTFVALTFVLPGLMEYYNYSFENKILMYSFIILSLLYHVYMVFKKKKILKI